MFDGRLFKPVNWKSVHTHMDIVKYTSRCESEAEIVTVNFPDVGKDRGQRSWLALADEKARELKIDFIYDYTDTGLEAEFHSKQDCNAVLAAMATEWKQILIESLGYYIDLSYAMSTGEFGGNYDLDAFQRDINHIAKDYGLTLGEIAEIHPLVNDL